MYSDKEVSKSGTTDDLRWIILLHPYMVINGLRQ